MNIPISDDAIKNIIDSVTEFIYCNGPCHIKEDTTWDDLQAIRGEIKEYAMDMTKNNLLLCLQRERNKQFLNLLDDGQYKEETESSALDEAIKHAEEVAEKNEKKASWFWGKEGNPNYENCVECAKEHRQLAAWLKELKQLREQSRWIPISEGLPKETGWYYVSFKTYHGEIETFELCYRQPENYWTGHDISIKALDNKDIVAWMPRPQPYQPDRNLQREQDETFEQEEEEL